MDGSWINGILSEDGIRGVFIFVLLAANVAQYIDGKKRDETHKQDIKDLAESLGTPINESKNLMQRILDELQRSRRTRK